MNIKFQREKSRFAECIVEFPPHQRTVLCETVLCEINKYVESKTINIPFYSIIYMKAAIANGLYFNDVYDNKFLGSEKSITSLDDIVHPVDYPHVAPSNMNICQYFDNQYTSFDKYIQGFVTHFWNSVNRFYMRDDFSPVVTVTELFKDSNVQYRKGIRLPLKNLMYYHE